LQRLHKVQTLALHLIFLLLMGMSVLLYKERLFADASYYLFHAINKGWFHIEHGRIVLGISQIFPLIGYYLHLPLKFLLVMASLGHELFYYAVFLLVFYKLKDHAGGLAVLLVHLLGQLWLYYSPMLEICYGAVLAVLFYSILRSKKYENDFWLILLLICQWFVMSSHPFNFLLIAVAIAYDYLHRGFQKRIHSTTMILAGIGLLLEFLTFSDYETGRTKHLTGKEGEGLFGNITSEHYLQDLVDFFTVYYPDFLFLFIIAFFMLVKKQESKRLLLMVGSSAFLLLIINSTYKANEFTRYNESLNFPLVFIACLFFAYEIARLERKYFRAFAALAIILSLLRIAWTHEENKQLQQRIVQLERLVDYAQKQGHSKYLIQDENFKKEYSFYNWANPIETLLFSAIDGKGTCVNIITEDEYKFNGNKRKSNTNNFVFRRFEVEDLDFLNPRYFSLKEESYQALNSIALTKSPEEMANGISIKPTLKDEFLSYQAADTLLITVAIANYNAEGLPSKSVENHYLSYHWYKDNELYSWDGLRTKIEVDVFGEYSQEMNIAMPEEAGDYELVTDIVIEGKAWYQLDDRYPIRISN